MLPQEPIETAQPRESDPLIIRAQHFERTAQGIATLKHDNVGAAALVRALLEAAVKAGEAL